MFVPLYIYYLLNFAFFYILANPEDLSEVFNLETLADFDLDKLPDIEEYGDEVLGQIQAAMEDLYGDSMAAAMPEDRIQPCLMGVSRCLTDFITPSLFLITISFIKPVFLPFQVFFLLKTRRGLRICVL